MDDAPDVVVPAAVNGPGIGSGTPRALRALMLRYGQVGTSGRSFTEPGSVTMASTTAIPLSATATTLSACTTPTISYTGSGPPCRRAPLPSSGPPQTRRAGG